jgi:hypothetical protein
MSQRHRALQRCSREYTVLVLVMVYRMETRSHFGRASTATRLLGDALSVSVLSASSRRRCRWTRATAACDWPASRVSRCATTPANRAGPEIGKRGEQATSDGQQEERNTAAFAFAFAFTRTGAGNTPPELFWQRCSACDLRPHDALHMCAAPTQTNQGAASQGHGRLCHASRCSPLKCLICLICLICPARSNAPKASSKSFKTQGTPQMSTLAHHLSICPSV